MLKQKIKSLIADKKHIFKDVTVLVRNATASDHKMLRATIKIDTQLERFKMIQKQVRSCRYTTTEGDSI